MKVWLVLLAGVAFAQERTVLDKVFTAEQVKRGEEVYGAHCAKCHEGADADGPRLNGTPFIDRWREDQLESLYLFIKGRMPRDAPGSLKPAEYVDLVTRILEDNEYPSGSSELTLEQLTTTMMVGKSGPQPLPSNTLVETVGCVVAGKLTRAQEPRRTHTGDEVAPEELKKAESRAAGALTITLTGLSDTDTGRRLVKGVLTRSADGANRIKVLASGPVAGSCP